MKKKHVLNLLITSFFFALTATGQSLIVEKKEKLPLPASSFSIDSEENIYLGFVDGQLKKYPNDDSKPHTFSFPNQSAITIVEAQNNRKIFLFYRDIQQISMLDRFSTIPKNYQVNDFISNYAESACISPDGMFWIAENNPRILKKIDPLRKIVIHEVQHFLGDSISNMRTLGNLLLLADENGLQILDQFGNLVGTVELKGITYIQLINDKVLLTHRHGATLIDPFKVEVIDDPYLKLIPMGSAILKLKNKFVVIDDENITYYSLTKPKE